MSNTIDQRIVEMQFDNAQFEKGISTSLKSLDVLKKKLNLDKEAKGLDDLKRAGRNFNLSGMASNIEFVASKFSSMGILGVTAMQRISNAAITTGKNLVSSLTIDPLKSGLSEYETQINAIQTILSNTRSKGGTIEAVNEALDTLNTYADKTIYNFTEMTRNIGTFTAAGVDLNTSTAAIKGIANLAAVSGSNSQQASTAMYQLSQALASGTIRLMDWNSVVNAGMGGEVFQDALKETARVHGVAIDKIISEEGSFRESLQRGWLSSQIMLETLQKFTGDLTKEQIIEMGYTAKQAEEIIALGKDANDAATKVKTFTQLIDTLKEALQSGWTQSWEYVIGNFEEARELWTSVSDAIGSVIGKNAEARNELLKGWYEAGGRSDLIAGVKDTFSGLYGIVVAVSDAMEEIFPSATVDDLLNISSKVKQFGANLKAVLDYRKELKNVGLEWTKESSPVEQFVKELSLGLKGDEVKKLQQKLKDLGYDLGSAGVDGIFGPKTEAALKAFQEKMGLAVDGVYKESDHESLFDNEETTKFSVVAEYVYKFSDALEKVKHISKGAFSALSVGIRVLQFLGEAAWTVLGVFSPVGSAVVSVAMAISDCFINLNDSVKSTTKFTEWIGKLKTYLAPLTADFESVKQAILDFFGIGNAVDETPEKIDTFIELWSKIKEIAGTNLPKIGASIANFFSNMYGNVRNFVLRVPEFVGVISEFFVGIYDSIRKSEKFQSKYKKVSDFFINIKKSLKDFFSVVQTAIQDFFSKDTSDSETIGEKLKERLAVFESVGQWLTTTWSKIVGAISWIWNSVSTIAGTIGVGGLLGIIGSIFLGVKAAKTIGNILKFTSNISEAFKNISKSLKISKKTDKLKEVRNLILSIALVIGTLVAAIYILGNMDPDKLKQGAIVVGSVVGGLILLATVATLIGSKTQYFKSAKNAGKSLFQFAAAIGIIAASITVLGFINWKKFLSGVGKIAVIMAVLGVFMAAVNKYGGNGFKATGLLSVVGAIGILALVARMIGGMDLEKFWIGVVGVAAIATILGVFAVAVNSLGGSEIKMGGLLGISLAIGILGIIATALALLPTPTLVKGIGAIGGIALLLAGVGLAFGYMSSNMKIGPALVILGGFALVIAAFGYVLDKIRDIDPTVMISFAVSLAGTLAAVVAAFTVVGSFAAPVAIGAGVIALIVGVSGLIIGIIGAIDEHCGCAILSAMQRGGEVMQAFGEAVGSFIGGIGGGIIEALSESAGEALTTFGDAIATFSDKITGVSASETLSSDIDSVVSIATAMASFFDSLGGITLNITGLSLFNSGTETLATDMDTFGTAISDFGTAVSGMAKSTFTSDTNAALNAATSIRDFLDGISSLDIEKNKGAIEKWLTGDTKTGSLFAQMMTLGESISSLNTNFSGLGQNGFADNVNIVKGAMGTLTDLLVFLSDEENSVDTSGFMHTSNFAKVVDQMNTLSTKVNEFNTNTETIDTTRFSSIVDTVNSLSQVLVDISKNNISSDSVDAITSSIGDISAALNAAGTQLATSVSDGVSSAGVDLSGVKNICTTMIDTVNGYQDNFSTAGYNLGKGLSKGMSMSRSVVVSAAKSVAQAALSSAKAVLGIHSPSKEFAKFGKYSDEGYAKGLLGYANVVTSAATRVGSSALNATRDTIAGISAAIASDIDPNPVIRPVVDMSEVTTGARMINGLMSGTVGGINIGATTSSKLASAIGVETSRKNQNGSSDAATNINQSSNSAVNLTGNNFYVRSEQDIQSLASEIAALSYKQQRNLGAT